MDLIEQNLSEGILRMSCTASALTVLASATTLIASPGVGTIKSVNSGILILIILIMSKTAVETFKDIKKINENIERNNIKKVRNMLNCLKDDKLDEEFKRNSITSISAVVIAILYAIYGMQMKDLLMGISSVTFGLSGLSYGKAAMMYQQLMNEAGVESKPFIKTKKSNCGPKF